MIKYLAIIALLMLLVFLGWKFLSDKKKPQNAKSLKSIYDYSYTSMDGKKVSLSEFKGKMILLVNVASKCGFTPQYEDLEKLYDTYKNQITVIGFPANDFKNQEPGTNEEIASFCRITYGVKFPMAQKTSVIGKDKNEIYKWLTDKSLNGWNDEEPKWNFHKYLIDEMGELIAVFPSITKPMSENIITYLNKEKK
jgi:glutathione peroxidase